eukprot:1093927-Pelagomonas_calceolata.AAC.2
MAATQITVKIRGTEPDCILSPPYHDCGLSKDALMLPVCINIRYNVNISKQSTATSGHMYSYTTFLVMLAVVSANALSCSGTCYLPHRLCECLQADVENYLQQF